MYIDNRELTRSDAPMPSIVFVARPLPSDIGPGGKHRAYQIEHDLKAGFGADCVHTLSLMEWRTRHPGKKEASTKAAQLTRRIVRRMGECLDNPLGVLHGTGYGLQTFTPRGFIRDYRALLERLPRPIITVIDDARFSGIVTIAKQYDVPVIACTHNLESLDLASADTHRSWGLRTHLIDLANELGLLQHCDGRMFISKVETALVSGLAMEAEHYPYRPVGAIRARLEAIRQARLQCEPDTSLFLMLGSAMHGTTRGAFEWFLTQARRHGLPQGIRLMLAGMDTDKLDLRGTTGIETLGWIGQSTLDRLLVSARAVVVPQFSGFGAVTRLVELSCAGVPALVPAHPTRAINVPPGVHVIGESWSDWHALLNDLRRGRRQNEWDYQGWEDTQPRPLHSYLSRWIHEA